MAHHPREQDARGPTSVPATMSRLLSRVKPDAATARPVKELSNEMSTGTSAPPMGSTKMIPMASDRDDDHDQQRRVGRQDGGDEHGHDGQAHPGVDGFAGPGR